MEMSFTKLAFQAYSLIYSSLCTLIQAKYKIVYCVKNTYNNGYIQTVKVKIIHFAVKQSKRTRNPACTAVHAGRYGISVFRKQGLLAVFDDGATGYDSDKGILIVHHRYKILGGGPLHQILHGGGDTDRHIVLPVGDFHNPMALCLTQIHLADVFHGPQQVAFRQGAPVFSPVVQDGKGGIAGNLHLFQCLPHGKIVVKKRTHRLWCQKKQDIILLHRFSFSVGGELQLTMPPILL